MQLPDICINTILRGKYELRGLICSLSSASDRMGESCGLTESGKRMREAYPWFVGGLVLPHWRCLHPKGDQYGTAHAS